MSQSVKFGCTGVGTGGASGGGSLSPGSLTSSSEARLLPPGLDNQHILSFRVMF